MLPKVLIGSNFYYASIGLLELKLVNFIYAHFENIKNEHK